MADTDFKILITSEADNSGFTSAGQAGADLSKEMGVVNVSTEDVAKATGEAGDKMAAFAIKGGGARMIAAELNQIIPGLGLAFRGLTTAMGPFAIIVLAIQAAITYWQRYKDQVKAAAEAHAAALDKFRESTKALRMEHEELAIEMDKASEPVDKYATALTRAQAILEAQIKAKRELMKIDEQAEMANAHTSEEKEAIKKKYGEKESGLSSTEEQSKINLLSQTAAALHADIFTAKIEFSRLEQAGRAAVATGYSNLLPNINFQLDALKKRIVSDQGQLTKYDEEIGTAKQVHSINEDERSAAEKKAAQAGEVASIKNISGRAAAGGNISDDEAQLLMRAANLATGHTNTLAQAVQLFDANAQKHNQILERLVAAIEKQGADMATLSARVDNARNKPGG